MSPDPKAPKPLGKTVGQTETEAGKVREEYEPSSFYISSTDKFHHNERLRVNEKNNILRVPTFVWALVNKWVADTRTPYRSASDFLRDSVVHRVHALEGMSESPPAAWRSAEIQVEMARRAQLAEDYKAAIADSQTLIVMAWTDGDMTLYQKQIEQAQELAKSIPPPYCDVLAGFLRDQQNLRQLRPAE